MIELYHWEPNAGSARVMIALKEKGLDFTGHYVDILKFEQYAPAFLAINPAGQVPVLDHDGHILTDSSLMLLYLEEAFPDPVLAPHDGKGWYDVLSWGKYIEYNLDTSISTLGWHRVMWPRIGTEEARQWQSRIDAIYPPDRKAAWQAAMNGYSGEQVEDSLRKITLAVSRLEKELADKEWLMASGYSIVDIDAFPFVNTLPALVPDRVNGNVTPRIMDWLERIRQRPAVREIPGSRRPEKELFAPGPEHSRWG